MAKNGKEFDIPRGNESSSENIRRALMAKIKEQESLSQDAGNAQSMPQQPAPSPYQQPQQAPSQKSNISYQQFFPAAYLNQPVAFEEERFQIHPD